ncbi:two-partner secretion domain-containing protein [Pseudomonas putida]
MVLNVEAIMKACHGDTWQGAAGHAWCVNGNFTLHPLAWALACLIAPGWAVAELPTGFNPVSGTVSQNLATPGAMTLQQTSERAIVNWDTFSIGGQNRVDISQPGLSSMMLNRVTGGLPSEITGSLTANGRVFLVNPNGVVFGAGSRVSTGGLVASTLDISNDDFNAGRLTFSRADSNQAAVVNRGDLQAGAGGTVALLGAVVRNEGSIRADGGTAALVSARQLSLDFQGDGLTTLRIDPSNPATQALVQNALTGVVQADGGRVAILADAASAAQLVVNQQGVLRARSLVQREGEIILGVGTDDRAQVGGVLDASGDAGMRGGKVNISGGGLYLDDLALVDVGGAAGGGRVDVQATQSATLSKGSKLNADARVDGKGGTLNLQGGPSLRAYGVLQARGSGNGAGGFIETSAHAVDLAGLTVQATGAPGQLAGTWVIDPFNITIRHGPADVCCVLNAPFDPVTQNSTIFDDAINASLDGGSNVTIHTGPAIATDVGGNIDIQNGVYIRRRAGSAPLELRFDANQGITAGNFYIVSEAGPLNVVFNANANGFLPQVGDIDFAFVSGGSNDVDINDDDVPETRSSIRTRGGNVNFFAGGGPVETAVTNVDPAIILRGLEIDTRDGASSGVGSVVMRGHTPGNTPVNLFDLEIHTARGDILIEGQRPSANHIGIIVDHSILESDLGAIRLSGSSFFDSGIRMLNGSRIFSGAGEVELSGVTTQGLSGLAVVGSTIGTASGVVSLSGLSTSTFGVQVYASTLGVESGEMSIDGFSRGGTGAALTGNTITVGSGNFTLGAGSLNALGVEWRDTKLNLSSGEVEVSGSSSSSEGVGIFGSDFTGLSGNILISAHSNEAVGLQIEGGLFDMQSGDLVLAGSSVDSVALGVQGTKFKSASGSITLSASSSNDVSVLIEEGDIVTSSGEVLIRGISPHGTLGVFLLDSSIQTQGGNVTLWGAAGLSDMEQDNRTGIQIVESDIVADDGNIDIRGRVTSAARSAAVLIDSGSVASEIRSKRGDVSVAGEAAESSDSTGLLISGSTLFAGSQLQFRAATDSPGQSALIISDNTLEGQGLINFRPGGVSELGELTDHVSTPIQVGGGVEGADPFSNFQLDQDIFDQVKTPLLIIGSDLQTGQIVVASSISVTDGIQLTLQAEGSGGSIDVRAPLRVGDRTLALLADGAIRQSQTGTFVAQQLVASSRRDGILLGSSNEIGGFAASAATDLRLTDHTGDLLLSSLAFGAMGATSVRQLAGTSATATTVLTVDEGDLLQAPDANVATGNLLAVSGKGSVQLNNASNSMAILAGQATQAFSFTNMDGLRVGTVEGTSGVRANQVTLRATRGDVTQVAGADIVSETLLVETPAGSVTLDNPGNAPHILAGRAAQAFSFTNLDNLSIGTVNAVSGVQAGSVFIRNLQGDLTLDQPVTATAGSAVLVTGGQLQNPSGQSISASSFWQIWADSWVGENRGGLVGSGSLPNLYGCIFGGACVSATSLAQTSADNHFIYRQQPIAQVSIGSGGSQVGILRRVPISISGLILGDNGNGISGTSESGFIVGGRPGTFPVNGSFTSSEGYLLTVSPGVWTNYLTTAVEARPDWTRERPDTWLYDHNMGGAVMCAAPGVTVANAVQDGDVLSREWSLVKSRPKLSSCVASDKQNGCSDF